MVDRDLFVEVAAIARRLHVSAETVRSWIRRGKLLAIQTPTGHYRVPTSAYHALLKRRAAQDKQDAQDAQDAQEMQESQTRRRKPRP